MMSPNERKPVTNGRHLSLKEIGALGSAVLSIITFSKVVFFAGSDVARVDEHLRYDDARIVKLEAECARAREIDIQIQAIKDSQHRLEQSIDRATAQLESDEKRRR